MEQKTNKQFHNSETPEILLTKIKIYNFIHYQEILFVQNIIKSQAET